MSIPPGTKVDVVRTYESVSIDKEIVIENCIVECLQISAIAFAKPMKFINCHFNECHFIFTCFLGGLFIDHCTFDHYVDFQSGGHNKDGNPVTITNNEFKGFVNFFDCWYESEVTISNNLFHKGTNLLGKLHDIGVTFDIAPTIKDNTGQLDINSECYF
jgi:hypothetical protein